MPPSREKVPTFDEEQAKEDRRNALEAAHADPTRDEYPDWNPKTHSIMWDIQHDYVLILYEKEE